MKLILLPLLIFILTLAGCHHDNRSIQVTSTTKNTAAHSLDEFKSMKFSMTFDNFRKMGYSCSSSTNLGCTTTRSDETIFGKPIRRITVQFRDDKAKKISVDIHYLDYSPLQIVKLYKKKLGAPKLSNYNNSLGDIIRNYYWIFPDGTSVIVFHNMSRLPDTRSNSSGNFTHIKHLNEHETASFLKQVRKMRMKTTNL